MTHNPTKSTDIAIIGMSCRFPGASNPDEFWSIIQSKLSVLRPTGGEGPFPAGYVDVHAPVEGIDMFDAPFFSMSPAEARITDPQQRLFLECAYRALEAAGYAVGAAGRHIGVFGATSFSTYLLNNILKNKDFDDQDGYQLLLGNDKDFLASRVSYKLNLCGPSLTVQSACSSSLVAVHLACQSILSGESEMALAGGVSLSVPQDKGHVHKPGGILSDKPSCRTFDVDAAGTVKGNGCSVVLLKPYAAALADGDTIVATIKATAVNNDGADKATFMAPSVRGQASVIKEALEMSGLAADQLDYVETHGTGTKLGDMVEVQGLYTALDGPRSQHLRLGTLKPNIGHLDAAAGVAGVIKAALVLNRQTIPAAVSFNKANPALELSRKQFSVVTDTDPHSGPVRHVGVSSFGVGGTNAHIIMGHHAADDRKPAPQPELVVLSAQSASALYRLVEMTAKAIADCRYELADVAHTLACTRDARPFRIAFVARSTGDLLMQMQRLYNFGQLMAKAPDHSTQQTKHLLIRADFADDSDFALHLETLADKWRRGDSGSFSPLFDGRRLRRLPLPGYVFDYASYWIAPSPKEEPSPKPQIVTAQDSDTLSMLIEICKQHLGSTDIQPDVDLADQGADSIVIVDLLYDVEKIFDVQIPLAEVSSLATLARIAVVIDSRRVKTPALDQPNAPTATRAVPPINQGKDAVRLVRIVEGTTDKSVVLIHPAGGTISSYVDICLSEDSLPYSVYSIPFPKEFITEPGAMSLTELAEHYLTATQKTVQLDQLVLGGYSFGGNVAYEMAHILARKTGQAPNLVLFDSHPPHAYGGGPVSTERLIETFALVIHSVQARVAGGLCDPKVIASAYKGMSLDATISRLINQGILPIGLGADDLRRFYRTWVINHAMLRTSRLREPVPVNALLLNVTEPENPLILENLEIEPVDHALWRDYVMGYLKVDQVPGDHYTAFAIPKNAAVVAAKFHAALAEPSIWTTMSHRAEQVAAI